MFRYILKKLFIFIISLFFIITLTFILMKAIPGDPFTSEQEIPKEILAALHKHYGLDKPLIVQYLKYLKGFITLNLGPSYIYQGRTVNQIISDSIFVSMTIGFLALIISITFGITLGSIASIKKNKWQDNLAILISILGISVPNFLLATFLQYFLAIKLKLFPVARWGSFLHTILPSLSLAAMPTAFIARLTKANMTEILKQDYIKTAISKGLPPYKVIINHGLKNALIPIIAYLGPVVTYIMTGNFVIEKIFGIPGLGQWLIHSISNRDYTVIIGLTVFFSLILMSFILISDIIIGIMDPRIKIKKSKIFFEIKQ